MSRYTGPQQRGAAKQARAEKRAAAEMRQAAEREREAQRRAKAAKWPEDRDLTDAELDDVLRAVAAIRLAEIAGIFGYRPKRRRPAEDERGKR